MENKGDLNIRDKDYNNVLDYACFNKNFKFEDLKFLLNKKAQLNVKKSGPGTLHKYLENSNVQYDCFSYFLEKKCPVNSPDKNLNSVLHLSTINEHMNHKCYQLLFSIKKLKVNITNKEGNSALHLLCDKTNLNLDLFRLFFKQKFDVNLKNNYGKSPLYKLCSNKNIQLDILKFMLENGCDPTPQNNTSNSCVSLIKENEKVSKEIQELFRIDVDQFFVKFSKIKLKNK